MILVFLLSFGLAGALDKQKVILDCDLGDDIDDAFAVGLILASPEFEVLGLVMDFLDTGKRAEVACRLLSETGREDIPVVAGRKTGEGNASQLNWAAGFDKVKPVEEEAADFIIRNLREYPGEVILFTVGPVPNLQDVMRKIRKPSSWLKGLSLCLAHFTWATEGPRFPRPSGMLERMRRPRGFSSAAELIFYLPDWM